ncbi:hypothetical protein BX616_003726 [Lobosporangium transversale]|uniref:Receptor ligand binding region domain-containing protein n=1 Tax=Lobosporangium transversale TaxID=64571 RepID=A0A1Y2GDQ3_9FUNG|nr:hypothetical protein BCR41DRAFT_399439 [Lobosporangium transversale]KAF9898687.1 hypothetical protein BX616_003726 [Lobosporangium transversale]ORZ07993.1 hypothetical protein BCR41DRAFT_399439 [Lobosporangium transversale]|eukprot:XP_021878227.1 hypothetical protein BCR41DRAFT_399439 [Lobosporangium transversale]
MSNGFLLSLPIRKWCSLGWNIEQMNNYFPISKFEHVHPVDLCPPPCRFIRERSQKIGWTNVTVIYEGALSSNLPGLDDLKGKFNLVTMSYLSMIGNIYALVDHIQTLLEFKTGVTGVSDFYTSRNVTKPSVYGVEDYQSNWLTHNF